MFKKIMDYCSIKKMVNHGYKYSKELNKFILKDYGVFLNEVSDEYSKRYLKVLSSLGYEIVLGPTVEDCECNMVGIYCKNYENVLDNRKKLKDDLDGLVDRIVTVSNWKDGINDEYIENLLEEEVEFLTNMVNCLSMDEFHKVVSDLKVINHDFKEYSGITLRRISLELFNSFYKKAIIEMDKDVDSNKVNLLISEAKDLAYDLKMNRKYFYETNGEFNTLEDTSSGIIDFVARVKKENSTSEIRGLIKGLKVNKQKYLQGSEYMVLVLNKHVKNKTIDEYPDRGKVKEKIKK